MEDLKGRNILIVDDSESNIDILMELLGDMYELYAATDGETALEILEEEPIDLVLLDILMPGMDGYEVCKRIRSNPKIKDIPVIFITAMDDEGSIEKAFEVGGNDYITKPFKPGEVLARVKMQLQLRAYQEELKRLASTDPLTGLYNRRHFSDVGKDMLEVAKRYGRKLSLIILDIDRFKRINDEYGHDAGDEVIKALADLMKNSVRSSDIVCRFGGEEFVILMPEISLEEAMSFAERLRKDVERVRVKLGDGGELHFTISIGVTEVNVSSENNLEPAIKRADNALYEAKRGGRNRVVRG